MRPAFRDLWLIFVKELTCCSRDPDVLIYGILLPIILYPLLAVLINEGSVWYAGIKEQHREIVAVEGSSPLAKSIKNALSNDKNLRVVDSVADEQQLRSNHVDAILRVGAEGSDIRVLTHRSGFDKDTLYSQIVGDIRVARYEWLRREVRGKGVDEGFLKVFHTEQSALRTTRSGAVKSVNTTKSYLGLLARLLLYYPVLFIVVIGATASVCLIAEEREKRTLQTTKLLPLQPIQLILGKFLAVVSICISSGIFNLVGIVFTLLYLVAVMVMNFYNPLRLVHVFQHLSALDILQGLRMGLQAFLKLRKIIDLPGPADFAYYAFVMVATAMFASSIFLFVASFAKSFKEAQIVISLPMILLMMLPLLSFIPGLQLNLLWCFVPMTNLFLLYKSNVPSLTTTVISMSELYVLAALFLFAATKTFFDEPANRKRAS